MRANALHYFWIRPSRYLIILYSTLAFTQVMQWRDEKGTVHLEAIGPKGPKNTISLQPKPNALRPIDRNFASLRLGDDGVPFTAAKERRRIGNNGYDGNFYSYSALCLRERSTWESSSVRVDYRSS
jgi:hypothetical protein